MNWVKMNGTSIQRGIHGFDFYKFFSFSFDFFELDIQLSFNTIYRSNSSDVHRHVCTVLSNQFQVKMDFFCLFSCFGMLVNHPVNDKRSAAVSDRNKTY